MDLATLFVRFKADTSDVEGKVKTLEANTKKSGDNIAKTLAAAFSAAAIGAGIKKSIDAASDLNETVSKTNVIFGDASKAIQKQGDTAATSMGLSKTAYLDAASGLKGLLDNLGLTSDASTQWSQKLVQLGSDLGSFFNKDPAEAITAIQAALRGESEPIRAFNVNISDASLKVEALKEGLYSGVGALDAHARAQAALALIMQQTTAAQGDFARTSDGAANSQRIAGAEATNAAASFGQVLLPVYTKVVQVVGDLAHVFGDLPAPVQTALIAMVGLVAIAGPLGKTVEVISSIKGALDKLALSNGGILLVVAAIGALAYILSSNDDTQAKVAARSKEVATALSKETAEIVKNRQEAGNGAAAVQGLADAQLALSRAITGSDENGKKLAAALGALGFQSSDATTVLKALTVTSDQFNSSIGNGTDKASVAAKAQADLAAKLLEQKGVAVDVAKVLVEAGQGASFMGDAAEVTKDKTKGWTDENRKLLAAIIDVGKQAGNTSIPQIATDYLDAEVAASKFRAGLVAQAEAQVGASRASAQAGEVYTAYVGILDNLTPAQQRQLDGTAASTEGWYKHAASLVLAKDATNDYSVAVDQAKANADASATATTKLSDSLTKTASKADLARKAADDFGKALDEVFGGSRDLEKANRDLIAGFDGLATSIADAKKNHEKNITSLDISTESGRKNRDMVQQQVQAILDQAKANIANGATVADATNATNLYAQQLQNTLVKLGFNKDAAAAYIAQLGLTPDNITTAIQLTHDEEAKNRLQGLLTQLGNIDAGAAAKIQAEIDQGQFDKAEADLERLTRDRQVMLTLKVAGGDHVLQQHGISALGRFVRSGSNFLTTVSEPGAGDEVILPLDNPRRIRELAGSNNVGSRILAALAGHSNSSNGASSPSAIPVAPSASNVTGLHVEHLEIHDDTSAQALAQIVMFKLAGV